MRRIARLSVTPVKSTALHHPEEVTLESFGVRGNRRFYLAEDGGRLFTSRYESSIPIRATYDDDRRWLSLAFPDGTLAEGTTETLGEEIHTDFWGRMAKGRVVEGPWNEALTAHVGRTMWLVEPDALGDANDAAPVSLVSSASADELARRAGRDAVDARRFRMLVEVDGCEPHEEDEWIGTDLRVGLATIRVQRPVARCRITTLDPESGQKDFETLKEIVAYRGVDAEEGINFGVYATVVEPGKIRLGDLVQPLPA